MQTKDKIVLAQWLRTRASLADVGAVSSRGLVDNERFTENARRAYRLIWTWSAYRLGGTAGRRQDRVWSKCGREFLDRRIERCRRIAAAIILAS